MRARILAASVLAVGILAASGIAAPLVVSRGVSGYTLSSWAERDGRPLGPIRALAQDADGYLWVGTDAGLLRFDGVRFVKADTLGLASLPADAVHALYYSPTTTRLWIGFRDGGGVRVLRAGRIDTPASAAGLHESINAFAEGEGGTMWTATDRGLYQLTTDAATLVKIDDLEPRVPVYDVLVDRDATVWVGTTEGLFRRGGDDRFERIGPKRIVRSIGEDPEGTIWVTDPITGFRRADASPPAVTSLQGTGFFIFVDSRGGLWVTTVGQGLWHVTRVPGDGRRVQSVETSTVETGLLSSGVWNALEDREHNIWVATHEGLHRLVPHRVTPILGLGLVNTVASAEDGSVWAGTAGGLLQLGGSAGLDVTSSSWVSRAATGALYEDPRGTLWIGSSEGLKRLTDHRLFAVSTAPYRLTQIKSIIGDGADGLWLLDAEQGLFRWHDGTAEPAPLTGPVPTARIAFVHRDSRGRVWVAFGNGRLGRLDTDDSMLRMFGAADGLPDGTHASLEAMTEGRDGTIWIGGSGGLTRFANGHFSTLSHNQGLPGRSVRSIAEDATGHLWVAIDSKIVCVDPAQIAKAMAHPGSWIKHEEFRTSDGLAGSPLTGHPWAAARATDGVLYFVTGRGITVIDPTRLKSKPPASSLPARVEAVVADDRWYPGPNVRLPAGTSRLRIDYTTLRLSSPTEVRFRYQLDGFDTHWVNAGTEQQAFYTNLPPRAYRFRVQAAGADEEWTPPAVFDFRIEPAWYQTSPFYGLSFLAFVLTAYGMWRWRLHHVRHEVELVYRERMRLGRDLHDTLLQSLAGTALQLGAVEHRIASAPTAATKLLARMREQLEDQIREARQSIWNLRSPAPTHDLAEAVRHAGIEITGDAVAFDVTVMGSPRACPAGIEAELLRIAQEAVMNAVRHARARHIRAELAFQWRALRLRVVDDGHGFDPAQSADDRHYGLSSMRERAAGLGGVCRIVSRPGAGSEVDVLLPLRPSWGFLRILS